MSHLRIVPDSKRFKFNHTKIEDLPFHDRDSASAMTEYTDSEVAGLKLAVSKQGRKYFWHRYRFRGQKRVIKLGEFPSVTLAQARQMVHENKNLLARDLDPTDERNRRRNVPTLAEFAAEEYLPYAKQHKKSWDDDESKLRREIGKMLGKIPLTEISTRDVMNLHASIYKKCSAATANRYLALLSRMFTLAIQWGHLERNPVRGVKKYKEAGPRY